tara:strand:- start:1801 stop:2121 length:321 start_codon:yes stop_codon:yes gene_type:complete
MGYSLNFLSKEHDLNKILRQQKKAKSAIYILYVSLWDSYSEKLVEELKARYGETTGKPVYVVNSFSMPHSFVIFKTTKIPHLVSIKKDKVNSSDYLPEIYRVLSLG